MTPKERGWLEFSDIVRGHVVNYAVSQYGQDIHNSEDLKCAEDCMIYLRKYVKRFGQGRRGRLEELRDLAKIAHLAQCTMEFLDPCEEELKAIMFGTFLK